MSGFVGLKFLLNKAHKQIMDLWEHVPSWSDLQYPAATTTPVEFQATSEISSFSSDAMSKFYSVVANRDYLFKNTGSSSFPNPKLAEYSTLVNGKILTHLLNH